MRLVDFIGFLERNQWWFIPTALVSMPIVVIGDLVRDQLRNRREKRERARNPPRRLRDVRTITLPYGTSVDVTGARTFSDLIDLLELATKRAKEFGASHEHVSLDAFEAACRDRVGKPQYVEPWEVNQYFRG
jgi:hypothetical protein